jgi:uncharacterized membrane protein
MLTLATALAADSDGWHHHHGWWIVFPILWLFLAAGVGYLIWRRTARPGPGDGARAILAERYAGGEITIEEYRERLANLP